ncbi:hypothetical protein GCM10027280_48790 [Micromonospora polyrhachis]|uniref:Helix-turn-helix domain-containing protein n=1 Tax=Micromonospora polyrhachis TaxID=1282883 RepID=A0A7W7SX54_9ACTN|nr:hypothetical protein [Micromonospora polyrhachis]MBB4962201.1 hypothetical protein [Micromonospora polyrhachis]
MRDLKQWSGFTYRELQRRAEAAGEVLPHSTIAAALGRSTLPRAEMVRAFVRACGGDPVTVDGWLAVRKRIAIDSGRSTQPSETGDTAPAPDRSDPTEKKVGTETVPAMGGDLTGAGTAVAPEHADRPAAATAPQPPQDPTSGTDSGATEDTAALPPTETVTPVAATDPPLTAGGGPDDDRTWPVRDGGQRRLGAATATSERYRWIGLHRHDPADEVPRPAGLRWLIPPIMYRTGWSSRVLSGVLLLILLVVATGFIVGALRDVPGNGPADADASPDLIIDADDPDGPTTPGSGPSSPGTGTPSATPTRTPTPNRSGSRSPSPTPKRTSTGGGGVETQPDPGSGTGSGSGGRLVTSVTPFCRDSGRSWAFTITGELYQASAGYDPTAWTVVKGGSSYGYPLSGNGSTRFSGTVPPGGGSDVLTAASTTWELVVWVRDSSGANSSVRASGTVNNPGCLVS